MSKHTTEPTTVDQVLKATSGWRPILNDMDAQYEVFLEVRGDKTTVIVTEDCSITGLIHLTPDGAEELAAELRAFAAAARSIVIDRMAHDHAAGDAGLCEGNVSALDGQSMCGPPLTRLQLDVDGPVSRAAHALAVKPRVRGGCRGPGASSGPTSIGCCPGVADT